MSAMCTFTHVPSYGKAGLTINRAFGREPFELGLVLLLLAIFHLQPALRRNVAILVFVFGERREEGSDARDGSSSSLLRRMVGGRNPSQGRARREQRKQVGWELVCHVDRRRA